MYILNEIMYLKKKTNCCSVLVPIYKEFGIHHLKSFQQNLKSVDFFESGRELRLLDKPLPPDLER